MSTTDNIEKKPSAKMKESILFNKGTEEFLEIIRFTDFYKFWLYLEAWVKVILIEYHEECHDA